MRNNHLVPQNDDEIVDAFVDLLSEIVPEGREEIEMLLVEAGLDPEKVKQQASSLIKDLRARTPLDWRNRREILEEVRGRHDRAGSDLPSNRQGLLERLSELLSDLSLKRVHAHYRDRKPEELSDEELRSLVHDLEFIQDERHSNNRQMDE
jgi:hypothetical protein